MTKVPAAWQERQRNILGWTSWYDVGQRKAIGKGTELAETVGGIDYEWRPLFAEEEHAAPIDMVLFCPKCGRQHIDAPEPGRLISSGASAGRAVAGWSNPPHRSHLCHECGHVWRPADVPTNGVMEIKTAGKADSPIARQAAFAAAGQIEHALWVLTEHNALHFGEQHNTVIEGRKALAAISSPPAPKSKSKGVSREEYEGLGFGPGS